MEILKKTDTQQIIDVEDAIKELNQLYVQMTYEVEFMEGPSEKGSYDNYKQLQEDIKNEVASMRKYIDNKFGSNSSAKLKYLIKNIKEMLIVNSKDSETTAKIKTKLMKQFKKIFVEVVELIDNYGFIDIDELGFSEYENKILFDNLEFSGSEKKILDELDEEKAKELKDITLITSISQDENEYGEFIKDTDQNDVIYENDAGRLIAVATYKAYQSSKTKNANDNIAQLPLKTVTKYEFQLKDTNGETLGIDFFGDSDIKENIDKYGNDYIKAICLAILSARRNESNERKQHIGSIEEIDKDIFEAVYDPNLENSIKQLVKNEKKAQGFTGPNKNESLGRDEG